MSVLKIKNSKTGKWESVPFINNDSTGSIGNIVAGENIDVSYSGDDVIISAEMPNYSGFNIFDTKIVDHILEGEDADGWALQGTYVYKNAITGVRSGYPDFYERCLKEYKDKNNTEEYFDANITIQGVPVINNGIINNFSATNWAWTNNVFEPVGANNWKIHFKILTHTIIKNQCIFCSYMTYPNVNLYLDATGHVAFDSYDEYYDIPISITDSNFIVDKKVNYIVELEYSTNIGYTLTIKDLDGNILSQKINDNKTPLAVNSQIAIGAELDESGMYYQNYYRGSIDLNDCYFEINGVRTWEGAIKVSKNKNTHMFYPISNKSAVDSVYEKTGYANVYGIDEENECVFLPRNKWLSVSGIAPVMGNGMTMGFTNGSTNFGLDPCISNEAKYPVAYITTYGTPVGTSTSSARVMTASQKTMGLTGDPDKSGIEAHLKTNEGLYLYYCVGNTKVKQAIQDEGDIVETIKNKADKAEVEALAEDVEALAEGLNGKVDKTEYNTFVEETTTELADKISREEYEADKENNTGGGGSGEAYLVDSYQSGYSWYRKYSDGWFEQGGMYSGSSASSIISLMRPYKSSSYTVKLTPIAMSPDTSNANVFLGGITMTSFMIYSTVASPMVFWEAKGYSVS